MKEVDEHKFILKASLVYHLHVSKTTVITRDNADFERLRLWAYVGSKWSKHLHKLPEGVLSGHIKDLFLQVFQHGGNAFSNMVWL